MMKSKTTQSKFMKIVTMPIRALGKARDFYVRSMNNYADNGCYGGATGFADPLPRSFSTNSVRSHDNDDYKELLRAASTTTLENRINLNNNNNDNLQHGSNNGGGLKKVPRSASVGMAKIEEDKPADFHDNVLGICAKNGGNNAKNSKFGFFPRSRSYAVGSTTTQTTSSPVF